jgi:hypothetical protein
VLLEPVLAALDVLGLVGEVGVGHRIGVVGIFAGTGGSRPGLHLTDNQFMGHDFDALLVGVGRGR